MKKYLFLLAAVFGFAMADAQIIVQGEITTNTTWTNDNIYILDGWVYVRAGATLTIEPGTLIKGDQISKGALIVERDAMIMAEGTAEQPIVFTSQKPVGERTYGDWGGVIICGRATINVPANSGNGTAQGEAIIEGGVGSIYGGGASPNDADNSGVLRYVRIEFCGIPFQPNSEINGLTLGGVGSGTTIDHIMVSYSGDDSYEMFGGTVDLKNIIAYKGWDDDFDTDFGYRGHVQFAVSVRDPAIADQSGSNGFESDNDGQGSTNTPVTRPIFSNVTIAGPTSFNSTINNNYKRGLHLRRNSQCSVFNSVVMGYPTGLLIDGSLSQTNASNNDLRFRSNVVCSFNDTLATTTNADPNNVSGAFNISTWFATNGWNNLTYNDPADLAFNNLALEDPDLTLQPGSPLNSGADFSNDYLGSFFEVVNFRGAFGSEDWTSCWAEWDPQHEAYNTTQNYAFNVSAVADGEVSFCDGGSVTIAAQSENSDLEFLWSNGSSSPSVEITTEGNFSVVATNSNRCTASSNEIAVAIFDIPVISIEAGGPTSFCTGGSVMLTATNSEGILWSNGLTTQSIEVSATGTFSATTTDENGCSAESNSISVNVSDSPVPTIATNGSSTICEGSSVTLTASLSDSYAWYLNGDPISGADAQDLDAMDEGLYTVVVTNENPCDGVGTSAPVVVFVDPTPVAAGEIQGYDGYTISLSNSSTSATSYEWNFGDGNTSTDTNPEHTYDASYEGQTMVITLTAYNGDCSDEITLETLAISVNETMAHSPMTISPNPANDAVWITLHTTGDEKVCASILDATGKAIQYCSLGMVGSNSQARIDVSSLESGLYFIRLIGTDWAGEPVKLIVRH